MCQQVVRTAIDSALCDDMVTSTHQILQRVGDSRRARRECQRCGTALQRRQARFECADRGIGQARVDVARIAQGKAVGGLLRRVEHIGGCLIDGYGACAGCGVGLLLSGMELQGFKMVFFIGIHRVFSFSSVKVVENRFAGHPSRHIRPQRQPARRRIEKINCMAPPLQGVVGLVSLVLYCSM